MKKKVFELDRTFKFWEDQIEEINFKFYFAIQISISNYRKENKFRGYLFGLGFSKIKFSNIFPKK